MEKSKQGEGTKMEKGKEVNGLPERRVLRFCVKCERVLFTTRKKCDCGTMLIETYTAPTRGSARACIGG